MHTYAGAVKQKQSQPDRSVVCDVGEADGSIQEAKKLKAGGYSGEDTGIIRDILILHYTYTIHSYVYYGIQ